MISEHIAYETDPMVIDQTETGAFSGDDVSVALAGREVERLVDGESYSCMAATECTVLVHGGDGVRRRDDGPG